MLPEGHHACVAYQQRDRSVDGPSSHNFRASPTLDRDRNARGVRESPQAVQVVKEEVVHV